jgi:RNA polymerase sigma-54 factor
MAFRLKQNLKAIQRLSLSPELKNSITILGFDRPELENFLTEELQKNPCLVGLKQSPTFTQSKFNKSDFQRPSRDLEDKYEKSDLHQHFIQQINLFRLSPYEHQCVELLLDSLDHNGFLALPLSELALQSDIPENDLQFALSQIQQCEPLGIGSQNLQECLLLQLKRFSKAPQKCEVILKQHWEEFTKLNVQKIARKEDCSQIEVKECLRFIKQHLDPKPARQFGEESTQIIVPDVYVFKRGEEWISSLNNDGLPKIKLSKKYQKLIDELKSLEHQQDALKYLNESTKAARWLIRSLEERNKTILKVTDIILKHQTQFFEHGVDSLSPLTLKDVANELGLHESTISRSTSGKYLFCPRGLFELKYFFNSKMENSSGKEIANESIKQWVQEYIKNEDKNHPLSDQDIADKISTEKNMKIARRTVSKYRESLKILSSSKRSERF